MKYFSTFSGIGGFEIGIQRAFDNTKVAGLANVSETPSVQNSTNDTSEYGRHVPTCVGYSEIDKYAIKVYERQFNGHKNYGDITKINADELPDFDCLVGGFPCQAFSIAGKRKGFEDTRGTLFFDLARILRAKQPRLFVFENVKGLLSHDNGQTFATIIATLTELGYDVQWQVLNSKNHGVPQNRERVIIVGNLGNTPRPKVFPITGDNGTTAQVHPTIDANYYKGHSNQRRMIAQKTVVAPNGKLVELEDREYPYQLLETRTEKGKLTRREIRQKEGRDSTLRGKEDKKYVPKNDNIANALTTGQANIEKWTIDPGMKIRRLTPRECERLQGFPDNWTKYGVGDELISDTQRYKMCGNAVTTNVIQVVFERILDNSYSDS